MTVTCVDEKGDLVATPAGEMQFSPAGYGILIENERVLLQRHPETGLWHPPGTLMHTGQTPGRAVCAHFRALTGLLPLLGPLLYAEEQYRLIDGQAWHLSALYFTLSRPAGGVATFVPGDDGTRPEWVPCSDLNPTTMQFGYRAVRIGQARLTTS